MLKFHLDILKEFKSIGRKTKIILYGSLARGEYRLDSDIDLAIITKDKKLKELASAVADKILAEHGKLVTLKFIDEKDLEEGKSPIIEEIKKGIVIYDGRKR